MFNVLKFVHLLLLTTQTSWDKLCLLKSFDDVSTEAYNRLSIIFPFLSDECGNDSCSCYCIPHWDADSIYSRMRIVTLESSWTLPHANRKEAFNMEINTQSMSWNQIHIPKRIVRDILELLYCHRRAISGSNCYSHEEFWWLTFSLIISYALWNDEIKLCITQLWLMLHFKFFLYWLKEFPFNKLSYSFSLNFLYLK